MSTTRTLVKPTKEKHPKSRNRKYNKIATMCIKYLKSRTVFFSKTNASIK